MIIDIIGASHLACVIKCCVPVRLRSDQNMHNVKSSLSGGEIQRRLLIDARSIHIGTFVNQLTHAIFKPAQGSMMQCCIAGIVRVIDVCTQTKKILDSR